MVFCPFSLFPARTQEEERDDDAGKRGARKTQKSEGSDQLAPARPRLESQWSRAVSKRAPRRWEEDGKEEEDEEEEKKKKLK